MSELRELRAFIRGPGLRPEPEAHVFGGQAGGSSSASPGSVVLPTATRMTMLPACFRSIFWAHRLTFPDIHQTVLPSLGTMWQQFKRFVRRSARAYFGIRIPGDNWSFLIKRFFYSRFWEPLRGRQWAADRGLAMFNTLRASEAPPLRCLGDDMDALGIGPSYSETMLTWSMRCMHFQQQRRKNIMLWRAFGKVAWTLATVRPFFGELGHFLRVRTRSHLPPPQPLPGAPQVLRNWSRVLRKMRLLPLKGHWHDLSVYTKHWKRAFKSEIDGGDVSSQPLCKPGILPAHPCQPFDGFRR